ncbi:MAG: hypothetical protein CMN00_01055 [Rickettsiales bacterium]|nr:hypothetical protein [Rickettsiales bacterium]
MDDLRGIRIGFFGTPDFALESLKVLKDSLAQIDFVATQSPKPSGRGQKVNFSVVHKWSKKIILMLLFHKICRREISFLELNKRN